MQQNTNKTSELRFTGERVIEDTTPKRIWLDHMARYDFAAERITGKIVLDIACGTGFGSNILKEKGAQKVVGVDISKEAIHFARRRYAADGLDFFSGDILGIDFPDNMFDVIVSFETIEHINNHKKALLEIRRVLKKEHGLLVISSPNRILTSPGKSINDPPDNVYHTIEYTTQEFISLLSGVFKVTGIYGQRAIHRFFIPLLAMGLERYFRRLLSAESGSPLVERCKNRYEYRYVIVTCLNT